MKVHLFGLPISTHRRLKEESGGWKDAVPAPHVFKSTPISTNEHVLFSDGELRELRAAVGQGFTHIVIPGSRDWKIIQRQLRFDCRVHIARLWQPIRDTPWNVLKERLHSYAKLDETWLEKISPADLRHPLLLPPNIFKTTRETDEFWHRCDIYSEERILEARELLSVVTREHRKPDKSGAWSWLDARKLRYRFDPSKHGRSSMDRSGGRSFRFCYEIPGGFHFDLTDDSGAKFTIQIDGKLRRVEHCNVTPWGHVR